MSERWKTISFDVSEHEAPVCEAAIRLILRTLRDPDVAAKHPPWHWSKESCDQHLLAAVGHANRAAREGFGFKEADGEDHLARAVTRCAEAAACRHIVGREPKDRAPSSIAEAL